MIRTFGLGALIAGSLAVTAPAAMATEFVNVLTGGTSGVYYPLGVAMADIYAKNIPDARTQVQSTKASVENLNLLQQGRGEIGFALGDSVKDAYEGNADVGFSKPLDKLRAIAAIYPNYIQIAASADAGVTTVTELAGKSVSVGAAKSGTEVNARKILGALGMTYDDLGKVEYLPFAESVELMKNRQLDATLQSSGLGSAALKDLSSTQDVTYVSIPADVADTLGAPYAAGVIPAGTYPGQDADIPTLAITNILVTSTDVSDELAYQMTKLLFENLDQLKAAHAAAGAIDIKDAIKNSPIPMHPGAEKYYKEQGLL
ncbi:TAXI family TRAP transporter solute-binding subunit [Yangia mangrovi]|uniref:C4-dicarboxylate ABC transporter n=1 Tax=Alloyangia mangrovi TaxID=1779329 RepID=A0A2A3K1K8_9RHOB|nr:TAXI family TRAP transporter solute-binding subunit [Alloyangia mangrovi]MCA0939733.1 TAXI family TRAP transporter solute-binding subunit [Alloyangia pacifica]MCA0944873.1 TAXI family TRAP transporter solute-binding subunit [Alloyangia pacifica]MCT4370677.1 TAXI family TRAP transporter solute-binding subunit [Alloyangia mangrovi]